MRAWTGAILFLLAACGGGGGSSGGGGGGPGPVPTSDTRLDVGDPVGRELSVFPEIARSGSNLYVVWYDRRLGDLDVFFNRSLDGGDTWLAPDVRIDTTPFGGEGALIPQIAADGDDVYVVWQDRRDGLPDVRFNRSTDAGTTWLPSDVRLDSGTPGSRASREPRIAIAGAKVYVCWEDVRDGATKDVYFNRSLDGGATWLPQDVRLDTDPGAHDSEFPRIACDGDRVVVAWPDARDGALDLRVNVSSDAGTTWLPADVRIDTDAAGAADSDFPSVSVAGLDVCVAWEDRRDGERDVRANVSADGGVTWLPADARIDTDVAGAADSIRPVLRRSGATLHVVWEDSRNGLPDVRYSRSTDGGATWLPSDERLDTDAPGAHVSFAPDLCVEGLDVFVVWADGRNGGLDVLLATSGDGGVTWSPTETRLDGDPAGAGDSLDPKAACGGGTVHVVWHDQRDGPGDVWYERAGR